MWNDAAGGGGHSTAPLSPATLGPKENNLTSLNLSLSTHKMGTQRLAPMVMEREEITHVGALTRCLAHAQCPVDYSSFSSDPGRQAPLAPTVQRRRQRLRMGGRLPKVTVAAQVCVPLIWSLADVGAGGQGPQQQIREMHGGAEAGPSCRLASCVNALWTGVGGGRLAGPDSGARNCSKNKNKLSNSGESQDFERKERPQEPQDMCYWVK